MTKQLLIRIPNLYVLCYLYQLRTQALASLHSGLQNNQGIPVAHVANWLAMEVYLLDRFGYVRLIFQFFLFHWAVWVLRVLYRKLHS